MNIFFLDSDPQIAATYMCDKHVIKMILESAQLLCTCHHITGSLMENKNLYPDIPSKFYKLTHKNHPCSKWLREHKRNYEWLATHAHYLCNEYSSRYNNKTHASSPLIHWLLNNDAPIRLWRYQNYQKGLSEDNTYPSNDYYLGGYLITKPPQCMPEEYKHENVVVAYRNYYKFDKQKNINCSYTKREKPDWLS